MKTESHKSATTSPSNEETRSHFWQSLEESTRPQQMPEWRTPEFQQSVNEMAAERKESRFNRRNFLKFMGAGTVMLGAACRRPYEQIVPAVIQPPEMVPGVPVNYASTAPDGTGIIIKTREGRPIKISGNGEHPLTAGGVSAWNVASTMDLYDPDRLRKPAKITRNKRGVRKQRAREEDIVKEAQKNIKNGAYALVTGPVDGPSSRALVAQFLRANPGGRHVEIRQDPTLRQIAEGQRRSYGKAIVPSYRISKAEYIISIDADFLGTMIAPSYFSAEFAKTRHLRNGEKTMSKLVVFESMFSVTGSNADERYSLRPGDQKILALALAAELVLNKKVSRYSGNAGVTGLLRNFRPSAVATKLNHDRGLFKKGDFEKTIKRVADEIWAKRGRSLVIGGSPLSATGQGAELQVAVNLLNAILENDGRTVDHGAPFQLSAGSSDSEVKRLFRDVKSGKIKTVILGGANPVYHLPASLKALENISAAAYVLSLNDRIDETSAVAKAILPASHYLESWGDAELVAGVYSLQQPAIRPLYNTKSLEDRLIQLSGGSLGGASTFHDFIKGRWASLAPRGTSFTKFWTSVLQSGYYTPNYDGLTANRSARSFNTGSLSAVSPSIPSGASGLSPSALKLGLHYTVQVLDGSGANNAYRQELPEPVTKIVYENYVSILPDTARALKLKQGSIVKVAVGSRSVELPVHLQPGLHPGAVFIALGFGRGVGGGRLCENLGKNALALIGDVKRGDDSIALSGATVKLTYTGDKMILPNTQKVYRDNYNKEDKIVMLKALDVDAPMNASGQRAGLKKYERPIVLEASLTNYNKADFNKNPYNYYGSDKVETPKGDPKIMQPWEYKNLRWHMVIDLTSCTGCGSCVTSCNTENNIPMVGPEEVTKGREMHWLRIDRYYRGDENNPTVTHQPMMCQHCENAPCENVCPVAATTHNSEGLNVMTYNRCIGTRYCSNNCPYKVRRFNWFENWHYAEGLEQVLDIRNTLLHTGASFRPRYRSPMQLGLNPDVTVRTRGVMEKCTFCVQRIAVARREMKARRATRVRDGAVVTACQEVCPTNAIHFGDVNDQKSDVHRMSRGKKSRDKRAYEVLDFLGVKPSVTYLANIRNSDITAPGKEAKGKLKS